ncbi:type II secretion system minor pseudopilin GspJ [Desulfurivibrio sp. D14AmB]|uniref:type II secretion system minor pseudopilin GspJ n=1 Tax=Desulfurivibrio sp. D14AmB TaxID=3374370 RepID=UPI00376EF3BC
MNRRGFTLLELLVALALFAVLSLLTFSSLRAMIDSREQTRVEGERLAAVQMAVSRLALDIQQARDRGIRDEYGRHQPAMLYGLLAGAGLELTRGGHRGLDPQRSGSGMQRLRYLLDDGRLIRESWPVLDRGPGLTTFRQPVLEGVELFEARFLDSQGIWHGSWPPIVPVPPEGGPSFDDRLPVAVELLLELEDWGRLRRLLPLAGGGL